MTIDTYWLAIGCAVCLAAIVGTVLFTIICDDRINDRNRSREAQRLALTVPIITPADRDLARLREAA
jgi:hypothetical protein